MDFFERQEQARRRTKWLFAYFVLAVVLMLGAIYVALLLIFFREQNLIWHPELFLGVSVGTLVIIACGSLYKIVSLRDGGSAVALTLGGRSLAVDSADPHEQRLLNVVEEMAIASGTAVPQLYVLPNEHGINAFAAGHNPTDAAIGVTRGSLETLTRDELQGVIAHEFSHILNGDMRLNLRLIGFIHGILCLAIVGRVLLRTASRRRYNLGARNKGGNPLPLVGIILIVFGSIGVFFGRLIKAAVSRQREFLADAAAVQFTRNPEGLAGALKKIGAATQGSRLDDPHAEEASHMFFGNGLAPSWLSLMATHPPLTERIKALDPSFDGTFQIQPREAATPPPLAARPPIAAGAHLADMTSALSRPASRTPPSLRDIHPGRPTAVHLQYAVAWKESLPEGLLSAAHDPAGARALVFGIVLSTDPVLREGQIAALSAHTEIAVVDRLQSLLPVLLQLEPSGRLPLVDLSLTGLRAMTPTQFESFGTALHVIIEHDREINLFEYTLQKIVLRHLEPHFKPAPRTVAQFHALRPLLPQCAVLLSALAHSGHGKPADAAQAFAAGSKQFRELASEVALLGNEACDLNQIDQALNRLALASPPIKKVILTACAHTVAADGLIHPGEGEMLRAIADTLDCPLPPILKHGV